MSGERTLAAFAERLEAPEVAVRIDGDTYTVRPFVTARDWVRVLLSDDPLAVLELLDPDDEDELLDACDDEQDPIDRPFLMGVCRGLIEAAAGDWRWWEAARLVVEAVHAWRRLDGTAAGRGVDLLRLPFDRFCNHIYTFMIDYFSQIKDGPKKFDAWWDQLRMPPEEELEAEWEDETEAAGWFAAAGQIGAGERT